MKYNQYIDHTNLKADATDADITRLCEEAIKYEFASVCVNPTHVALCAELLKDTPVKVCTVIGFPLGANTTSVKVYETKDAIRNGADEVDMVINVGALKSDRLDDVYDDIKQVVDATGDDKIVKVIIETCLLTDEEKVEACRLAAKAGADFVKTSTGFSTGGATVEDVALMKKTVGPGVKVKAAGGIRTHRFMTELIDAGADRIGASAGVKLLGDEA